MSENSDFPLSGISKADSDWKIGEFWDRRSLAEHWDETRDVDFEVRAERRHRITLAPEVYAEVEKLARRQGVLTETLVNLWLAERLKKAS